ncbi:MAG: DNA polymerase III subunit gamma/tau [Candidatus Aegiribacteria sp.]|nr:DNA polymerase III subunit gamma/tau [Candidatus Aegiribacteria sp.]
MSYLVFARKWRPQSFEEVLSQDHVTVTLRNAIETDRIGHAYLMTGPRGVGKTTTARILAKALNCENGPTPTPCQECDSCRQIAAGNHMDVLEIDGASNRGIDQIRDLREKARYATVSGRYKIYIIDEVHMLTNEAFNALLKILEEPPDSVVFIFATTRPRKVPDTILSRCQRFDFRRISVTDMSEYLRMEASKEGISLDSTALSLVCRSSGGSMRDALSLMDQLVSYSGTEIRGEEVVKLLGIVETDLLAVITTNILAGETAKAIDSVSAALARGYSVDELIDALTVFLRNLLLIVSGASGSLEDVPDSEIELLRSMAPNIPDVAVLNILRIISGAAIQIKRSTLPRVILETAIMTASKLSCVFPISDLPDVAVTIARNEAEAVLSSGESVTLESKRAEEMEPVRETGISDNERNENTEQRSNAELPEEDSEITAQGLHPQDDSHEDSQDDKSKGEGESESEEEDVTSKSGIDNEKEKETSRKIMGLFDAV